MSISGKLGFEVVGPMPGSVASPSGAKTEK